MTLFGWVQRRRDLGGLIFIDMRDRTGIAQVVCNPEDQPKAHAVAHTLQAGVLHRRDRCAGRRRPEEMRNPAMATGDVEVIAHEVVVFNEATTPPFVIEDGADVNDTLRLKYRYLDLQQADACSRTSILQAQGHRSASGGTMDAATGSSRWRPRCSPRARPRGPATTWCPSRVFPGKFYALPQSPQLFKQLLMVSGFDRYYQIVKCFRDEDLRADRQPEFTQIDIEMSFVGMDDVLDDHRRHDRDPLQGDHRRGAAAALPAAELRRGHGRSTATTGRTRASA
ncbi:MAG: OB-fold nucleic acid binding domain-containing protein [Desulfobacterales bacterium]|nr:OB-fold nucleic acid binding domain-containing protein [Desulfobacterales bacterium]